MGDYLYRSLALIVDAVYWGGELGGMEHVRPDEPGVYVANHLGPNGPIGTICAIPVRFYPWIIADMVDPARAAEYLRVDFVEKSLGLHQPASARVARWLSRITVPLLIQVGCVPVYHEYGELRDTLQCSVSLLEQGKSVLVFPEDPQLPMDPVYKMCPFRKTVARLGELYYQQTRKRLYFYPVCVHETRMVRVGAAIRYDPCNAPALERLRIKDYLEKTIRRMYLETTTERGAREPFFNKAHIT